MFFRDYSYGFKILGEGFSSVVYKAKKYKSKHQFALKIIKEDFFKQDYQIKFIQNQIAIHQAVKHHKNFVNLIQHGKCQNYYVFVMEYCQKGSLADFLQKFKKLSQPQAIYIIKEVIEAYRLLNSLKILHRDIKPGNILITQKNQIKLCDFGLSTKAQEINQNKKLRIGTPCFMAPQVAQQNRYTSKADIWSIGVTYYLMLKGQLPFKSHNYDNFIRQVKQTNIESIIPADMSEVSRNFIIKTLNYDINKRMSIQQLLKYDFEPKIKQLSVSVSSKQIRSKSTKSYNQEKTKSSRNLVNKTTKQVTSSSKQLKLSLNLSPIKQQKQIKKRQKQTQTTQGSEKAKDCKIKMYQSQKQKNISRQNIKKINKQNINKKMNQPILQLSPCKQQSPTKQSNKLISKQSKRLIIKQMQKITRIIMNQIDLIRYIKRLRHNLQKYFKGQFSQLKYIMKKYIEQKIMYLKRLQFVDKQKIKVFVKHPLYEAWMELILDYQKNIRQSSQNSIQTNQIDISLYETLPLSNMGQSHDFSYLNLQSTQLPKILSSKISQVILQVFLQYDKSIKTKQNANKLMILDHLICLKDLLQMLKRGQTYFLNNSMLNIILDGLQNMDIDATQINYVFAGISKKLTQSNYSQSYA